MTWSTYNTEPSNFNYEVDKYADNSAQVKGVGCAGTNQGYLASQSVFVEPPYITGGKRRRHRGKKHTGGSSVGGSSGYGFTDIPIAPVAGPGAPYSEIRGYNNLGNYRDLFPPLFKGGKRRYSKKHIQYGCNNTSHKHKRTHKKHGGSFSNRLARRGGTMRSKGAKRSARRSRGARRSKGAKRSRSAKRSLGAKRSRGARRSMRGGMSSASDYTQGRDTSQDQPYGNKAYSFTYGLDSNLGPNESALAMPIPALPMNNCGKYMRD